MTEKKMFFSTVQIVLIIHDNSYINSIALKPMKIRNRFLDSHGKSILIVCNSNYKVTTQSVQFSELLIKLLNEKGRNFGVSIIFRLKRTVIVLLFRIFYIIFK